MGGYDETPEMFARDVGEYMRRGLVNIVGGCCGTTPAHIFELAKIAGNYAPRPVPAPKHVTTLSGLEPLRIVPAAHSQPGRHTVSVRARRDLHLHGHPAFIGVPVLLVHGQPAPVQNRGLAHPDGVLQFRNLRRQLRLLGGVAGLDGRIVLFSALISAHIAAPRPPAARPVR